MLYDRVADLPLSVEEVALDMRERETTSGFTRTTTVVSLRGNGETGRGEDVTYDTAEHERFASSAGSRSLRGEATLDEFSDRLAEINFFPDAAPSQPIFRNYRRWAFESAALDLALKQADTNLAARLDRSYDPVRFVVSTRLAEPPTGEVVLDWLDRNPDLEFKLDPTAAWTDAVVERLAATDAVRILDLKGQYHGTSVDQPADPKLYERVIDGFPTALIEDPDLTDATRPLFDGAEDRVTWDYPIRGVKSVADLPWEPQWLNVKPSRFGSVESLLATIEYCQERGIRLYGGGQFELDVGREHLHAFASLFYPTAPNDVAPRVYNDPDPGTVLPTSPLDPPADPRGLSWS